MSTEQACIYCGRPADSDEHIFGTWLVAEIEKVTGRPFVGGQVEREDGTVEPIRVTLDKRGNRQFNFLSDMICTVCNNGWMNVVDEKARPYIRRMMRGEEVAASGSMRKHIASWAVKTAITARFAHVNPDPVEGDWPRQLHDEGNHRPSRHWAVWLTRYVGPRDLWYRQGELHINEAAPVVSPARGDAPLFRNGVVMTLVICQFCVQVVRLNGPAVAMTTASPATIQIWPNGPVSTWPPEQYIEDSTLEVFANRFYSGDAPLFIGVERPADPSRPTPEVFVRDRPITDEELASDETFAITCNVTCKCGEPLEIPVDTGAPLRDLQLPLAIHVSYVCPSCGEAGGLDSQLKSVPRARPT
jgi:hypothetical protein